MPKTRTEPVFHGECASPAGERTAADSTGPRTGDELTFAVDHSTRRRVVDRGRRRDSRLVDAPQDDDAAYADVSSINGYTEAWCHVPGDL